MKKIIITMLFICSFMFTFAITSTLTSDDYNMTESNLTCTYTSDVLLYYDFDGLSNSTITYDSSYNNWNGVVEGANLVQGKFGTAYNFTTGNNIEVDLDVLDLGDELTVALWVYGDDSQPISDFVFHGSDSSNRRVISAVIPWSNDVIYWDAGNSDTGIPDRINLVTTTNQTEGGWNHWAFTKNISSGSMKIYHNGTLFHSGTGKTRYFSNITRLTVGSDKDSNAYNGLIDDFIIFDRELSVTEIGQLASQEFGFKPQYSFSRDSDNIMKLNLPFEGNSTNALIDYSGNSNDGTNNGATWNSTGGHDGDGAFSFDGINDYIDMGSITSLQGDSTFAVSFWANPTSCASNKGGLSIRDGTNGAALFLYYPCDTSGTNGIRIYYSGASIIDGSGGDYSGAWHHFAFVSRSATDHEAYVDGVSVGTSSVSKSLPATITNINIGMWRPGQQYFNGTIDEVKIYDRPLSTEQILKLYQNNSHIIVSNETVVDDIWACNVYDASLFQLSSLSNNLTIRGEMCNPTLDVDWIIDDLQICDTKNVTTGTGSTEIKDGGELILIDSNLQTSKLNFFITMKRFIIDTFSRYEQDS